MLGGIGGIVHSPCDALGAAGMAVMSLGRAGVGSRSAPGADG